MDVMLSSYFEKHGIEEGGQKELIEIFNRSLIEISEGIMRSKKEPSKVLKNEGSKRYASKKAEEYAEENDLTLEDFTGEKISKKDVDSLIKERTKLKLSPKREIKNEPPQKKSTVNKVICCGLTKKGEICNRAGTHQPEGAKKKYCFRHSEDWKSFECMSDSSDSESESESDSKILKATSKNLKPKKSDSDSDSKKSNLFGSDDDSE